MHQRNDHNHHTFKLTRRPSAQPEAEEGDEGDEDDDGPPGAYGADEAIEDDGDGEEDDADGPFKKKKRRERESDAQLAAAVESMVAKVRRLACLLAVAGGGLFCGCVAQAALAPAPALAVE